MVDCAKGCGSTVAWYTDGTPNICDRCEDWEDDCQCSPEQHETEYRLCPQCRGTGKMVARHSSVWTSQDRYDDPEGFETMLRGGYDVTCDRCNGLRVVTVESEENFRHTREDHHTYLMESGIYPGNPDYF